MRFLGWTGLGLALLVCQTTLVPSLRIGPVMPDLLLGSVILLAVYGEDEGLLLFAPALGYVRDLYSAALPGTSFLVFFLLAWFIRSQKTILDFDSYLLDLVVAGGVLGDGVFSIGLRLMAAASETDWNPLLIVIAGRILYTVLLVEASRFLWRNILEGRLEVIRPARRFRELPGAVPR